MKKSWLCLAAVSVLAFCNSNFSIGFKTDLFTGLKVSYKGLSVEESYLSVNQEKLKKNEVDMGDKVFLYLREVQGFVEKEGRVYLGASMTVTGSGGETVIDRKDLYAQFDGSGVSPADAKFLSLALLVGDPMAVGKTYLWKTRIWDKNGKGEITSEVKVRVNPGVESKTDSPTGLKVANTGLDIEESYLAVGQERLKNNEVDMGTRVFLYLRGVGGFSPKEGRVYPGASMTVTGPDGETVIDEKDLYAQFDGSGVSVEDAKSLSLSLLTGSPMAGGKTYVWKARIWDKLGKGQITSEVKIKIK